MAEDAPTLNETLVTLRAAAEETRLRILALLAEGELSVSDLTYILGQSQPRISRHLKLLVEAGLVERRALPGDRRSHALHLTAEGRALAERGLAAQRSYVARTLGRLPPADLAELERIVLAWRDLARADAARAEAVAE